MAEQYIVVREPMAGYERGYTHPTTFDRINSLEEAEAKARKLTEEHFPVAHFFVARIVSAFTPSKDVVQVRF